MRPELCAWILAGGKSRRMGQDKARLLFRGEPLLVRNAKLLGGLTDEVRVIASEGEYDDLGFVCTPDLRAGCGPLAGIETALSASRREWNLIVACDMPFLEASWLGFLVGRAVAGNLDCVVSKHPERGMNPLCGVWNRRVLPIVRAMLDDGQFRVRDAAARVGALELTPEDPKMLANWNEPVDVREE